MGMKRQRPGEGPIRRPFGASICRFARKRKLIRPAPKSMDSVAPGNSRVQRVSAEQMVIPFANEYFMLRTLIDLDDAVPPPCNRRMFNN
ncbi:hypothetical protein E4U41_000227 [Claviceps citrina]|nr:hypothetical protein E4U41_000227 [Claviceps citrina]